MSAPSWTARLPPPAAASPASRCSPRWVTLLSWRVLTDELRRGGDSRCSSSASLIAGVGGRWPAGAGCPPPRSSPASSSSARLLVLGTDDRLARSRRPATSTRSLAALSDALETSRSYAAPVQAGVPPVHPLLLIGGTLVVVLVDVLACTLRRAPVAGLVLLAAYTVPVAVDRRGRLVVALRRRSPALFLTLVFLQHSDARRPAGAAPPDGEQGRRSPCAPAPIGNTAVALGAAAIALAVVVPAAVPDDRA